MMKALVFELLILSLFVLVFASDNGFYRCNCDDEGFWSVETIMEWQRVSDFMIAIAYFSIPVEIICFVSLSNIPFKWVLVQFVAFIVLCGLTHMINCWTYAPHSFQLMLTLTVFKVLTALVSFATAITLMSLIPLLLKVKVREFMLQKKTLDLDREVGIIKKRREAGWHVRMLTREIRKSLDRHTILYTTLVELSKTLDLPNCVVWMPNVGRTEMFLTHALKETKWTSPIPTTDADVREIKGSNRVKILHPESVLAVASSEGIDDPGAVAAIRMPMLRVSNFKGGTPEMVPACYAILVLVLPDGQDRFWSKQELEIVEVVADQVAVALSHAAVLEESQTMRDKLVEQNRALEQAREDALMASQTRNTFQVIMSNGLRKPMHSVLGLLHVLQDESLNNEQKLLANTMVKISNVLSALVTDVMDTSAKDDEKFPLDMSYFQMQSMLKEAVCLAKCLCSYKGCELKFEIDKSLPNFVVGDERRVFQVILHMVTNLLNRSNGGGCLVIRVYSTHGALGWNDQRWGHRKSNSSDGYVYFRLEVGIRLTSSQVDGILPALPHDGCRRYNGAVEEGMSFNACRKLVQLMQGDIWMISNAPGGFDQCMVLVLWFRSQPSIATTSVLYRKESSDHVNSDTIFNGLKVLLADADNVNRAVTWKLLVKLGCTVSAVSSGQECLSALGLSLVPFSQIVILDLHLHDLDGFEVTTRIRKLRSHNWPLIIALTADDSRDARDRCLQSGMNGVIKKSGSFQEIAEELKRILVQTGNFLS